MAVEFISSRHPPWKAIKSKLKFSPKQESPTRVNLDKLNQRNLGPGTYSTPLPFLTPRLQVSSVPRFSSKDKLDLLAPKFKKVSLESLNRGKVIFQQNLDLSPHQHSARMTKLKEASNRRMSTILIVQKTKEIMEENKKKAILGKLEKRYLKFSKWYASKSFIQAYKGWVLLSVVYFLADRVSFLIQDKKKNLAVLVFNSSLLYQMSRSIGRVITRAKEIRKQKALNVIKNMFFPVVKVRLEKMIKRYKNRLLYSIEYYLTKRMLKKLLIFWKRKVFRFHVRLQDLIVIYKTRADLLARIWNQIQTKFNQYSGKLILPERVSLPILRKYLITKLKKHYLLKKEYKEIMIKIEDEKHFKNIYQSRKRNYNPRSVFLSSVSIVPPLRLFNKDDLILLYLDEERKIQINNRKASSNE